MIDNLFIYVYRYTDILYRLNTIIDDLSINAIDMFY